MNLLSHKFHFFSFILVILCAGLAGSIVAVLAVVGYGEDVDSGLIAEDSTAIPSASSTDMDMASTTDEMMLDGEMMEMKEESGEMMETTEPPEEEVAQHVPQAEPANSAGFLVAHNNARAAVGVSPLAWSETLAASAQSWANTLKAQGCEMYHSNGSYGENLYWAWSSDSNRAASSPAEVTAAWVSEKSDYDYDSNSCEPGEQCGHYTQIVWADTTHVGCAQAECRGSQFEEIWVCQYNPPGNYVGQRPY